MSRKLCLERLETRDTPSAVGPVAASVSPPPLTVVQAAPVTPPTNGTSVALGIPLINTTLTPGSSTTDPTLLNTLPSTPVGPLQPYQFYQYDPSYYSWMITPTA